MQPPCPLCGSGGAPVEATTITPLTQADVDATTKLERHYNEQTFEWEETERPLTLAEKAALLITATQRMDAIAPGLIATT